MTKRRNGRAGQELGVLKTLLVVGSVGATLAGTRLLALQEAAADAAVDSAPATQTVIVPAAETTDEAPAIALPPTDRGVAIELAPIPGVVQPNIAPVARTRSSR